MFFSYIIIKAEMKMGGITTEPKIFTTFAAVMKGLILHS